ncbi:MAG: thioredoxin fold domain-containing protein [Candidatus Melainabacteria bacterium]|nr:thioredoxin fold domain-containing protein [Candidatus Melainabacteria bacterium]
MIAGVSTVMVVGKTRLVSTAAGNRTVLASMLLLLLLACSLTAAAHALPAGFAEAVQSYKSCRYSQALSQFQAISKLHGSDVLTRYYIGLCYHSLNQVGKAQNEYEWVAIHSADPALKHNAQVALQQLGQYQAHRAYQGQGNTFARANTGRPRVIDFYTTWCGPCKRLAPILSQVESEFKGKVEFERLDAESPENAQLVQRYGIDAYPTVIFLDGRGLQVNKIVGLTGKSEYVYAVQQLLR